MTITKTPWINNLSFYISNLERKEKAEEEQIKAENHWHSKKEGNVGKEKNPKKFLFKDTK